MTDWYQTKTARKVGFTARPVVGGVFAADALRQAAWKKCASRDQTKAADWAPMPTAPKTAVTVPTSEKEPVRWRYTTRQPEGNWFEPDFRRFGLAGRAGRFWDQRHAWRHRAHRLEHA